jgi:YVTN family beta-propeller protein
MEDFMSAMTRGNVSLTGLVARWFVILLLLVPLISPAVPAAQAAPAAPAVDDDFQLKLKARFFDPAAGLPADLVEKGTPAVTLSAPAGRGPLYVVQFTGTPAAAEQARLAGLGLTVLDYLPERALIVRLSAGTSAGSLRSIPGVRAVVPFAPRLRMSPNLHGLASAKPEEAGGEEVRINAWLSVDGDPDALAKAAQDSFHEVDAALIRREPVPYVQFSGPPARLEVLATALAHHPDVLFVDAARPIRLLNDQSVWIGQSYNRTLVNGQPVGPTEAAAADPKPYTSSGTVFTHGITGTGQIIGITDTRLEHNLCYFNDPAHPLVKQSVTPPGVLNLALNQDHRKIIAYNDLGIGDTGPYATFMHGTHVSGSALGDCAVNLSTPANAGHDAGDGMAPNAKLVYLDTNSGVDSVCLDSTSGWFPVADMLQQEYDAGARLSTNSWGGVTGAAHALDAALWQKPDLLVFFGAGNWAPGNLSDLAGAKNVVGVGAAETYDTALSLDPEDLADFSSQGPSQDGRIKPDLAAPGVSISSAMRPWHWYPDVAGAHDSHCYLGDPNNVCFTTVGGSGCYVSDPAPPTPSTTRMSGTSMASPTAAGLGALARQYFTDGFFPTGQASGAGLYKSPSAALLKAVLINGARNMTGNQGATPLADAPSNTQGWGRIMLDDSLYFSNDSQKLFVDDVPSSSGVATGASRYYKADATSTASPLKVTLVWTDPPDSAPSGVALRNDLDLIVYAPDGTTFYKGNQWTDNPSVHGDKKSADNPATRDSKNNVEGVLIPSPQVGQYRFEVKGASVPGTPPGYTPLLFTQGFAIVVTGAFTGGAVTGPPPTITSVSPNFGVNIDPTVITIAGTNFQATPQVYLGTAAQPQQYPLSGVTFDSSTQLHATVPVNLVSGLYRLTVVNPDSIGGYLNNAFNVAAPLQGGPILYAGDPAASQIGQIDLTPYTLLSPLALNAQDVPVDVAVSRNATRGVIAMLGSNQPGKLGIMSLNPLGVIGRIDVPGAPVRTPRAVAIHPSGNPAYVLTADPAFYPSQQYLSRYDFNTGTFTNTIAIGNMHDIEAADLQISPDGTRLYATNVGDDTISVIRTSDFVEIARVAVGDWPVGIGVSPDSTRVYVTNSNASTISKIDATLATPAVIGTINVANAGSWTGPNHVVVSPDGASLYVAFSGFYTVSKVNVSTGAIGPTASEGGPYTKVAYVPSLAKLYALDYSYPTSHVKRLNPTTLAVESTINLAEYANGMDWAEPDDDWDGIPDGSDNCPLVANPGQENCDGDPQGNACDENDDNDLADDNVDCDDCNPNAYPTNTESCTDPADNDCDGVADTSEVLCQANVAATRPTDGFTASVSKDCQLPTGIVSGDLLLLALRSTGADTHSTPTGWTQLVLNNQSDASDDRTSLWYRKADGSEVSPLTVSGTASLKFACLSWRITGAADPAIQPPQVSSVATGTSTSPNPGPLAPTGGTKMYLWIWLGGWEGEQTSPPADPTPTNYGNKIGANSSNFGNTNTNCRLASVTRNSIASSEDPGSWTISASDDWTAYTIAVHP